MDREVLRHFGLPLERRARPRRAGSGIVDAVREPEGEVRIAVVGKYTNLLDSYKSLAEALAHGGIANRVKVQLDWVDSQIFEQPDTVQRLEDVHGILVPGGFGERGTEGKIAGGALRPRAQRAVLRHLLRHADGGDRGARATWPGMPERLVDRVRPDATSRWSA